VEPSHEYSWSADRSSNRSRKSGWRATKAGLALALSIATLGVGANVGGSRRVGIGSDAGSPAATSVGFGPSATIPRPAPVPPSPEQPAPGTPDRRSRVAFFGDSLGSETHPHLARLLADRGADYRFEGYPGAATCDYLDEMRSSERDYRPDVVVMLFTGNALTPCITDRSGDGRGIVGPDGSTFDLSAFETAYLDDTRAAVATFGATVDVVLVGPPPTHPARSAAALFIDVLYQRIADEHANVWYLSPDRLLTEDGDYVDELPCTFIEPCNPGERVPIRADDRGHLCAPQPTFCFGGYRMGVMISDRVGEIQTIQR
jgi:hypothetical protein